MICQSRDPKLSTHFLSAEVTCSSTSTCVDRGPVSVALVWPMCDDGTRFSRVARACGVRNSSDQQQPTTRNFVSLDVAHRGGMPRLVCTQCDELKALKVRAPITTYSFYGLVHLTAALASCTVVALTPRSDDTMTRRGRWFPSIWVES